MKKLFHLILFSIASIVATTHSVASSVQKELAATPQNVAHFLKFSDPNITPALQNQLAKKYLDHYYSPWVNPFSFMPTKTIAGEEKQLVKYYLTHPGWGHNKARHTPDWINSIASNMDLTHFSTASFKAITVSGTPLRLLPSLSPSFGDPKKAGEGFPFDNLQVSFLNTNLPLYVIHSTQDHAWNLVVTSDDAWGWVQSRDIAAVDNAFAKQWQTPKARYITPIEENQPILSGDGSFHFSSRIGQVFHLIRPVGNQYEILIAAKNARGHAISKLAYVTQNSVKSWPLTINQTNITQSANKLLGLPYGWGGLYEYRDCSATTKDLFASFGIWLPRNSFNQSKTGKYVSVAKLDSTAKAQHIIKNAVPGLTLLWIPGHIVLYLGHQHNQIYIFHDVWGVHTKSYFWGKEGRDVIGRTVVTPLNLGQGHLNIPKTWQDLVQGYVLLVPTPSHP